MKTPVQNMTLWVVGIGVITGALATTMVAFTPKPPCAPCYSGTWPNCVWSCLPNESCCDGSCCGTGCCEDGCCQNPCEDDCQPPFVGPCPEGTSKTACGCCPEEPGDPNDLDPDPGDPGDPSDPGDPGGPGNPGDPGGPGNPDDPGNPGDPGGPGNPDDPGDPGNPGDPGGPDNPDDPGDPGNPGDPGGPGNPDDPGNPDGPGDPPPPPPPPCKNRLDGTTTTLAIEFPDWSPLRSACRNAAKAAPMIQEITLSVAGNLSATRGTECCDPDAYTDPVFYTSYGGSVNGSASITLNIPGWSWYFDAERQTPIIFHAVFQVNLGPTINVSPSLTLNPAGKYTSCGNEFFVSLSALIDVGIGFGGKMHALVRVFEEGHWYTIDTDVEVSASASANSNVSLSGQYTAGSGVSGVTVGYGEVTATGQATFTVTGYGISISRTWKLLNGYSYPGS